MKTQRIITIVSIAILGAVAISCSKSSVSSNDTLLAGSYSQMLPKLLKIRPEQVHVVAGAGFADVSISGVTNDVDKQRISAAVSDFNAQNPKADPIKLKFD